MAIGYIAVMCSLYLGIIVYLNWKQNSVGNIEEWLTDIIEEHENS